MKSRICTFLAFLGIFAVNFFAASSRASAYSIPSFPGCDTPTGSVIASYNSGIHGIAGGSSDTGKDSVYEVNDQEVLQCLCSGSTGVQTNWWKLPGLTLSEIQDLEKQGWVYIPSGSVWGLDDVPYMAFNVNGSCSENGGFTANTSGIVSGISQTVTNGICANCIWWPILLAEAVGLIILYGAFRKSRFAVKRKYLFGLLISVVSYIIFLILNRNGCGFLGSMNFILFVIPCKYFWAVDGIVYLLLSFIFKSPEA